jgi:hypothetical protein
MGLIIPSTVIPPGPKTRLAKIEGIFGIPSSSVNQFFTINPHLGAKTEFKVLESESPNVDKSSTDESGSLLHPVVLHPSVPP